MEHLSQPFVAFDYGNYKGLRRANIALTAVKDLIDNLSQITTDDKCLRIDQTKTRYSYFCRVAADGSRSYLKKILPKSKFRSFFVEPLLGTLATVAAFNSLALEKADIKTPSVQILFEEKTTWGSGTSYIVTKEAKPFVFIEQFIHDGLKGKNQKVRERSKRIRQWASFVANLHSHGCYHFDLSNYNVMVRADESSDDLEIELVDLDMLVVAKNKESFVGRLMTFVELVILNAMFKNKDFRRIDKLRFLQAYWGKTEFRRKFSQQMTKSLFNLGELGRNKLFRRFSFALSKLFQVTRFLEFPQLNGATQ